MLSSSSSYLAPNAFPGVLVKTSVSKDHSANAFRAPVLIGPFAPSTSLNATLAGDLVALAGERFGDMFASGCRFIALARETDLTERKPPKLALGCWSAGTLKAFRGFDRFGVGPFWDEANDPKDRFESASSGFGWLAGRAGVIGGCVYGVLAEDAER